MIGFDDVQSLLKRYDGDKVKYSEGIVSSTHVPASGDNEFQIGGDAFKNRFVLETPIDGYGMPKIHLSLLRMVCTNGAVGYSRAFRTQITTGKDPLHSISRALHTYDNDNGYAALWQRFESAQNSWASLRETQALYSLLLNLGNHGGFTTDGILKRFYAMSGRPHELYGIANLDAFSQKRQRVLPAKCRVYDLSELCQRSGHAPVDACCGAATASLHRRSGLGRIRHGGDRRQGERLPGLLRFRPIGSSIFCELIEIICSESLFCLKWEPSRRAYA